MVQSLSLHLCDLVFELKCFTLLSFRSLESIGHVVLFRLRVIDIRTGDAPVLTLLGSVSLKELKFFLEAGNLLMCLFLIECPLSDELSSQVLYLLSVASLNSISFLPHHSTPYAVQFVEYL